MPKIRNRRWKKVTQARMPMRFMLPGDKELVEACAAIMAIECAFQVVYNQTLKPVGPYGKEVMARESCLMVEKQEHQGRVGTNDSPLFRQLYIEAFERTYPVARSLLLEGRMQIDPTWTEQERALFYDLILQRVLGVPAS